MSSIAEFPADQLAANTPPETQRLAARMAQDAFAEIFRLTLTGDAAQVALALPEVELRCSTWCQASSDNETNLLRLALLTSGIDQWGLAYSQTFGLTAIPGITALLGNLRANLDARSDAQFQILFSQLDDVETDAVDFKVELRRSIHLALWHAMIACERPEESQHILKSLVSMMLALDAKMPQIGWRMLADALASIQISLLSDALLASALAQEATQQLFEALRQALPTTRFQALLAYSGQAVVAWQQSRRPAN
jgi:hypothetical protein